MSAFSRWSIAAVLAVFITLPPSASHAAPYNISFSGEFDANAPSTPFSRPGAAWSVSFDVDSNPVPLSDLPAGVRDGYYTTVPFSNFVYRLSGATSAQAWFIVLYSAPNDGGLSVFFDDVIFSKGQQYEALELFGPQIYSGPESSPTLLTGSFPTFRVGYASSVQLASGGLVYPQGQTVITVVPEPGTGLMLVAGAVTLGLVARARTAGTRGLEAESLGRSSAGPMLAGGGSPQDRT